MASSSIRSLMLDIYCGMNFVNFIMQDSLFCSGLEDHSGRSGNSLHLSLISSFQISGPTLIRKRNMLMVTYTLVKAKFRASSEENFFSSPSKASNYLDSLLKCQGKFRISLLGY